MDLTTIIFVACAECQFFLKHRLGPKATSYSMYSAAAGVPAAATANLIFAVVLPLLQNGYSYHAVSISGTV